MRLKKTVDQVLSDIQKKIDTLSDLATEHNERGRKHSQRASEEQYTASLMYDEAERADRVRQRLEELVK